MGRGSGTGQPIYFMCSKQRAARVWPGPYPPGHEVVRTGRERGKPTAGGYSRSLHGGTVEYRCSCGHVGWTKHVGVLRCPIEEQPTVHVHTRQSDGSFVEEDVVLRTRTGKVLTEGDVYDLAAEAAEDGESDG